MSDKFKCINCGFCCKNMSNLALFEWEKDLLKSIDPSIEVKKGHAVKYKNTEIILYWGLKPKSKNSEEKLNEIKNKKKNICPFLEFDYDLSKCKIYSRRPLVCRSFPIFHLGFNSSEGIISMDCPEHIIPFKEKEKVSKREFYLKLYELYGDTFIDAFRLEIARVWIADLANSILDYLSSNDIVIENKEIGLLELAVNLGILSNEEIEEEINFIYSSDINELLLQIE